MKISYKEFCPCSKNCPWGCPCDKGCEEVTPSGIQHDMSKETLETLGYKNFYSEKFEHGPSGKNLQFSY